ncbi:hypothetical protein CU097_010495 [Rhizopus azygosporus]|uniref:FAD dependent oxidoreductase domain-containing protein n=1 Tax=Rhizopus azygosporus TaxID=86630 RepID=A0A367JF33_RHIAZ|nr:hypothetical protein CU097_010495 [Rhizopus azygosporus]
MTKKVLVLGAGVSGLTSGICLLRNGFKDVIIAARHLPGDISSEYTSPWAGASIITAASPDDYRLHEIDLDTKKEFARICDNIPDAHVSRTDSVQYVRQPEATDEEVYWVKKLYDNVRVIPKQNLKPEMSHGYTFTSYVANVPKYLRWLLKTYRSLGGRIERRTFNSIQEAIESYPDVDSVVNCTGYGSHDLKDVKDDALFTLRGQTVLVRAPHIKTQYYDDSATCWTYIIPRDDGTVICGGTVDPDNKATAPDEAITKDILKRVYEMCPDITHGKGPDAFDIVSYNVGFRPARRGGIRIEKEIKHRSNGQKVTVCHNYGHGSHGYQSSWGCSQRVVKLLKDERLSKL